MRLLCCGNRDWDDYPAALKIIQGITLVHGRPEVVIEGEASGADTYFRAAAEYLGIPVMKFPADWSVYGRAAGSIRNAQMLEEGEPTHLVALARSFTVHSGTLDMCLKADREDVPMACLVSRSEVENWVENECPFGALGMWLPQINPVGSV